jgi:hypothetical protein
MMYGQSAFKNVLPETHALSAETILRRRRGNPFGEIKDGWLRIVGSVLEPALLNAADIAFSPAERSDEIWTLRYKNLLIGEFSLDFSNPQSTGDRDKDMERQRLHIQHVLTSLKRILISSCKVKRSRAQDLDQDRGALGLILSLAAEPGKFHRVGAFYPGVLEEHHHGLRLFTEIGQVKEVIII